MKVKNLPLSDLTLLDPQSEVCLALEPEEYAALKEDIKTRGLITPLCITKDNVVLAGHHRFRIAKELDFPSVPCVVVDPDPWHGPTAFAISENLLHRSMTPDKKALMLAALRKEVPHVPAGGPGGGSDPDKLSGSRSDAALAADVGVNERQIRRAMQYRRALDTLTEEAPEELEEIEKKNKGEKKVRSVLAAQKRHQKKKDAIKAAETAEKPERGPKVTILHADSFLVLPGEWAGKVDLVVTDPPYLIADPKKLKWNGGESAEAEFLSWDDTASRSELKEYLGKILVMIRNLLADNGSFYLFLDRIIITSAWEICENIGLAPKHILCWTKTNPPPMIRKNFANAWEAILFGVKGKVTTWNVDKFVKDVFETPVLAGTEREWGHETQKPIILLSQFIEISSNPGNLVCDPFGGSGSTGEAAATLGRNCLLCEQNKKWVEICRARLASYI